MPGMRKVITLTGTFATQEQYPDAWNQEGMCAHQITVHLRQTLIADIVVRNIAWQIAPRCLEGSSP